MKYKAHSGKVKEGRAGRRGPGRGKAKGKGYSAANGRSATPGWAPSPPGEGARELPGPAERMSGEPYGAPYGGGVQGRRVAPAPLAAEREGGGP
ncbi:hypothetical protein GCM10027168_61070 [Streptomyces capparidis]